METFFLVHVRRKRRDCFYIYIKILKKDALRRRPRACITLEII